MSYVIMTGPALAKRLKTAISAEFEINLAVAFWGGNAAKELGLVQGRNARVICNLMSGGTNPGVIRELQENGIEVRKHATLHSKMGVVGEGLSFVGSSNMSANGLGFEGSEQSGWEETNVVFDHADSDLSARFEELWSQSTSISAADLDAAYERWSLRRTFATQSESYSVEPPTSIWQAIAQNDERLRSSPCVVAYYQEMEPQAAKVFRKAVEAIWEKYGEGPDAYQDWEDLPYGYLLNAERQLEPPYDIADITVWKRISDLKPFKHEGKKYQIVAGYAAVDGFLKLSKADQKNLKELIASFVAKEGDPAVSRIVTLQALSDFYQATHKT